MLTQSTVWRLWVKTKPLGLTEVAAHVAYYPPWGHSIFEHDHSYPIVALLGHVEGMHHNFSFSVVGGQALKQPKWEPIGGSQYDVTKKSGFMTQATTERCVLQMADGVIGIS